jgi:hypothetical protein
LTDEVVRWLRSEASVTTLRGLDRFWGSSSSATNDRFDLLERLGNSFPQFTPWQSATFELMFTTLSEDKSAGEMQATMNEVRPVAQALRSAEKAAREVLGSSPSIVRKLHA